MQIKQKAWLYQYMLPQEDLEKLFVDWIYPNKLEDFRNKIVLECGCGNGQHTRLISKYAKKIFAVDLNTIGIAKTINNDYNNIEFIEDDIAEMNLGYNRFDIVLCIGVLHHTDNPEKTFHNLKRHCARGGKLIIWVVSDKGNYILRYVIEPLKKIFLKNLPRKVLLSIAFLITIFLYLLIWSVYRFDSMHFLPYFEYLNGIKRLSFYTNVFNIFDKLNYPQIHFISLEQCKKWMNENEFEDIYIDSYKGISWRLSGIKRNE